MQHVSNTSIAGVKLNSERTPGVDQELYDAINGIRMTVAGGLGCNDLNKEGDKYSAAETFVTLSKEPRFDGENPERSTITVA